MGSIPVSLIPRRSVIGEKSAWYPLFAHVWFLRFLWGTWKLLVYQSRSQTLIVPSERVWARDYCYTSRCCTTVKRGSRLHLQDAAMFNQAVSYALGKVGKPGMALKDEQLTAIQHVHNVFVRMPTYGQVKFSIRSYYLYRASRPLWKGRSGVSLSPDLKPMVLESNVLPNTLPVLFCSHI